MDCIVCKIWMEIFVKNLAYNDEYMQNNNARETTLLWRGGLGSLSLKIRYKYQNDEQTYIHLKMEDRSYDLTFLFPKYSISKQWGVYDFREESDVMHNQYKVDVFQAMLRKVINVVTKKCLECFKLCNFFKHHK